MSSLTDLKFFGVASELVDITFGQFAIVPAFLNNSLEDVVDMIPPVVSTLLQNIANVLELGLNSLINAVGGNGNLDFNIPEFSVSSIALNILDVLASALGVVGIRDMSVFSFVLGSGAVMITVCVIGRWFYKLFD